MPPLQHSPSFRAGTLMTVMAALSIVLSGCAGSRRTAPAAGADTPYTETWEGTFESDEVSGTMKLVLTRDGTSWKGTMAVRAGLNTASGPVTGFNREGDAVRFFFSETGPDVLVTGSIEGDRMTGRLQVYQGDELIDQGTFTCTRRQDNGTSSLDQAGRIPVGLMVGHPLSDQDRDVILQTDFQVLPL